MINIGPLVEQPSMETSRYCTLPYSQSIDNLQVTVLETTQLAHYTMRKMCIQSPGEMSRDVSYSSLYHRNERSITDFNCRFIISSTLRGPITECPTIPLHSSSSSRESRHSIPSRPDQSSPTAGTVIVDLVTVVARSQTDFLPL